MMRERFTPRDKAVRDDIVRRVDENLCVEAGAGTGKTTVLVERIVSLLRQGHCDVGNLAVITFTEKAAAELAGRVRQGLEDARASAADDAERATLTRALDGLNRAHIETIHAFATALLRERPVEARLDPMFDVLTDLPADLDFDAVYDEWLSEQFTADTPPEALLDALDLGLDMKRIREAAERLHENRDLLPAAAYPAVSADIDAFMAQLQRSVEGLVQLKRYCSAREEDGAYRETVRLEEMRYDLEALRDRPRVLRRALALADRIDDQHGSRTNWSPPARCGQAKTILAELRASLKSVQDAMKQQAMAALVECVQRFVQEYAEQRRREGKAGFEDLLIWARDLLRDNGEVRRYFQQKYRHVLVDEFQDSDPVQVELIVYLCAEEGEIDDWRRARLRPGALFVVGDPKQSIYRFRRADITTYDAVKREQFGERRLRTISQNFRSARPIVDWVNEVFKKLILPERGVQPEYVALEAPLDMLDAPADSVTVVRGMAAGNGRREAEAAAIAGLVREGIENGLWRVEDGKAATYRDVAVLVRTRWDLYIYEDAFARAGVPYRHEGGRSYFERQEVREFVAVLRAIDDPTDGVAAVAALRSPAFGCSDEDLFLWKRQDRRFSYLAVPDDATGVVAEALRELRAMSGERGRIALPELVRGVLDRTRLVEFAMLQPQGDQAAANLLKLIDQARAFAAAGGGGLRGFVRWLRENINRTVDEADASVSEEADEVVRIMTVHGAKGLEFPVVVFANMDTRPNEYTTVIADRAHRRLHLKLGRKDDGFVTPGFWDANTSEEEHNRAEQVRLLYVAATRAQHRLIVPFFDDGERWDGKVETPNDRLRQAGADRLGARLDASAIPPIAGESAIFRRGDPLDADEAPARRVIAERDAWAADRAALVQRASRPLAVVTASALKDDWERPEDGGDAEAARRSRGASFGIAVHALLERAVLARPDDAQRLAPAIAAEFGLIGREDEIERVARTAMRSDAVARALRSRRMLREVPFIARVDGDAPALAEGRIDLLFEEDGAIVVADFKTDSVSAAEADVRTGEYRNQALVYAWAAHRATAMPVREVVFVFARPGAERSIAVDSAFLAEGEALVRGA